MKLIDIAKKIDKSDKNKSSVDTEAFSSEFDYEFDYLAQNRLQCYWIGNWYCTDSYVGWRMYFLDDKPVAVSSQMGRKYNEEFEWFSNELALKVREYLISIMPKKEEEELNFKLCDINDDIGEDYKISFNSQILNPDRATYDGESIEILERIRETPDWGIDKQSKVKLQSGEERIINIDEISFKFNLG